MWCEMWDMSSGVVAALVVQELKFGREVERRFTRHLPASSGIIPHIFGKNLSSEDCVKLTELRLASCLEAVHPVVWLHSGKACLSGSLSAHPCTGFSL